MTKLREKEVMCAEVLVREVGRQLGVNESTVRYRLKRREEGVEDGRHQASVCDEYEEVIGKWMEEQAEADRPESIRTLFEGLVAMDGYEGSYRAVVRYVRRHSPPPRVRPKRRVDPPQSFGSAFEDLIWWRSTFVNADVGGGLVRTCFRGSTATTRRSCFCAGVTRTVNRQPEDGVAKRRRSLGGAERRIRFVREADV